MVKVMFSQITDRKDRAKIVHLLKKYQILIIKGEIEREFFVFIKEKAIINWMYGLFGNHALSHDPWILSDGKQIKRYTIAGLDKSALKKKLTILGNVIFYKEIIR